MENKMKHSVPASYILVPRFPFMHTQRCPYRAEYKKKHHDLFYPRQAPFGVAVQFKDKSERIWTF